MSHQYNCNFKLLANLSRLHKPGRLGGNHTPRLETIRRGWMDGEIRRMYLQAGRYVLHYYSSAQFSSLMHMDGEGTK